MVDQKKTRNKELTINNIYETFFDLVLEIGYHKTSTNKIAQAADISVGTLYHHFPKGKKDIIRNYFKKSVDATVDINEFAKFDINNPTALFKGFVTNLLENHKENKGFNIAFRTALLSDNDLITIHNQKVDAISRALVIKLRELNPFFKSRSEDQLIKSFTFIYNITNAMIYHHLVFMDLFDNDEDLIEYLSFICSQTIGFLKKKSDQ